MFRLRACTWLDFSILLLVNVTSGTDLYMMRKGLSSASARRIYSTFTLLAIFSHSSGGMQMSVERAAPRADQERCPFGMGERQHGPSAISGVPDEH
jgi:hypothetical protein